MPAPPPMNSSGRSEFARSVNTPYGPVTSSSCPGCRSPLESRLENLPSSYTLIMNSSSPSPGRLAIENDRTSSLSGIRMSTYWPAL